MGLPTVLQVQTHAVSRAGFFLGPQRETVPSSLLASGDCLKSSGSLGLQAAYLQFLPMWTLPKGLDREKKAHPHCHL